MQPDKVIWAFIYIIIAIYMSLTVIAYLAPKKYREMGVFVPFENVLYAVMAIAVIYGVYIQGVEKGRGELYAVI